MSDDLARLRRSCLDVAAGLARGEADAWADAGRLAASISDHVVGLPLTPEQVAAGDRLVDALMADGRRLAVERLLDCARTLAPSAHERLHVEGRAAAILGRLAEDEAHRARGVDVLNRMAEKEAARRADEEDIRTGRRTPAEVRRDNHLIAKAGSIVRTPDGRPVIRAIGKRRLTPER